MNDALQLDLAARPAFVDNRDGNTLADALTRHLAAARQLDGAAPELCIASTFFNLGGFASVDAALKGMEAVRLLLGAEPMPESHRPADQTEREALQHALDDLDEGLKRHRDLLPFDRLTTDRVRRLLEFLARDSVRVRLLDRGFMHAKMWHLRSPHGGLVVGSSNFTAGGMKRNLELNLGHGDPAIVNRVADWYDELWAQATDFDIAAYYAPLLDFHAPWLVFMRVLYELYGAELEAEAQEGGIPLLQFQKHGVQRAIRLLERYHGVLVADGVGLGKTYTAGELMSRYVRNRQRVLLVAPAALRDSTWKKFLSKHQLFAECVSYEELGRDRQLGGDEVKLDRPIDEYALVVVDEAHAYRNPSAPTRAGVLRRLLQGPRRDLVLLTATPVNNSLWDLFHLLRFFLKQDAALADQGILSLSERFKEAMKEDPFDLNPDLLFPIIDAVTVKRTRHFIAKHYRDDMIEDSEGNLQPIRFPKPVARSIDYDLEALLPGYLDRIEAVLAPDSGSDGLRLARYKAEKYPAGSRPDPEDTALVGLLRSQLLKRFESSVHAFRLSLERMIEEHERFLEALAGGTVATKELLQEISAADDQEDIESLLADHPGGRPAREFNVEELRKDVDHDLGLLRELLDPLRAVRAEDDPKLHRLVQVLDRIAKDAERDGLDPAAARTNRKVLLFSYYEDTVHWVRRFLERRAAEDDRMKIYADRIVSVAGDSSSQGESRESVVASFAPRSMENPDPEDDRFDLLLATDVLAEGVNLQQCRNIINLDLPWNPMRLVQRHGRVDRINSPHERVFLHTFFPDRQLDRLLRLEERVRHKLAQAAASVGLDEAPIADAEGAARSFTETREEIERLHEESAELYERGGTESAAQSGEEYREQLRRALSRRRREIVELPWKAGSIIRSDGESGHVFCARVRDRTYLRFVPLDPDAPVDDEIGSCLRRFECEENAEHLMDGELIDTAFDAWARARSDIHSAWMHETDPANLQPRLRPVSRRIAEQLSEHPPTRTPAEQLERWMECAESPIPLREERVLREILDREGLDEEQRSKLLGEAMDELGLEPFHAPDPLDPVPEEEVRLVCWLGLRSSPTSD
ncbi:helicase [Wenzhouxiangella sp. XN79A]|uniref:helicase-related protein n=1 Tax=Wenzhouxiangella sp. XN79A TaxID=2724193 RepID=UPI00144A6D3A|nr:helicase-related protein [Wenzhouxiangella sp. XN79A]NKI35130.1 helicase [Wenzhouxiangella sp. XN79A]